jgi:hypothetical protein
MAPPPGAYPSDEEEEEPGGLAGWQRNLGAGFIGIVLALTLLVAFVGPGWAHQLQAPAAAASTVKVKTPSPVVTPPVVVATGTPLPVNQTAIFAGMKVTVKDADEETGFKDYQAADKKNDVVQVDISFANTTEHDIPLKNRIHLTDSAGTPVAPGAGKPKTASPALVGKDQKTLEGIWYFEVPKDNDLTKSIVMLGDDNAEVTEAIPVGGKVDDSAWQLTTAKIGGGTLDTQQGAVFATSTETLSIWTPGFQAPKGMRLLQVPLSVKSVGSSKVDVPMGQFVLKAGSSIVPLTTNYGNPATVTAPANGAGQNVGTLTFVVPSEQTAFNLILNDTNGKPLDSVDLGTH